MTGFRPCPMCGGKLTMKDVFFCDDEGDNCDYISDQFTQIVGVSCECGYNYATNIENVYDELEDLYDGGKWEEKFMALANRRHKEVG